MHSFGPRPPVNINMANSVPDPFYNSPFSPYFRRHTPYFGQPDYRVYELNKRLQQRSEVSLYGLCSNNLLNFLSLFQI